MAALTIGCSVAYTAFSESLNISVRGTWAYSDLMPVVPVIGTGLSPLLQWVAVPRPALHFARPAPQGRIGPSARLSAVRAHETDGAR